ncbi:hypothetical protein DPMN_013209 [Dreissena polymorpha]|uniref:Uncharacterized protein n=1 Tax=Dreissena polymorpha TaxID=45954 RepID=A0A9D4N8J1_DREPO|nr:hypothetical protein DPMN_013209 [Dreissena polymorpha]
MDKSPRRHHIICLTGLKAKADGNSQEEETSSISEYPADMIDENVSSKTTSSHENVARKTTSSRKKMARRLLTFSSTENVSSKTDSSRENVASKTVTCRIKL